MGMEVQAKANYLQACILHSERFETTDNDAHFGDVRLEKASNEAEQEALEVGEQMEQEQQQLLAGKYKSSEELEKAYLELQKKLGSNRDLERCLKSL